jgi:hypothetical protein
MVPMNENEVQMLTDICTRIREEFASCVYIEATKRWSQASVRQMMRDAMAQLAKIDDEMIRIAFSDIEEEANRLEASNA